MNQKRIAIVTGASGGLGKEFVKLLAQEETLDEIWVIARTQEKLERLSKAFGSKIRTVSMDLSDKQAILNFASTLEQEAPNVQYLVNNAGYAKFCSYEELSVADSLNMIDCNVGGMVAMGLVCIPHMEPGGHILNISSQASFQPLPYLNLYSATKAFMRNYSRALNVELKEKGITVTAVCPSWMKTDLFDRAEVHAKKAPTRFVGMVPADKVARKALGDAKKGRDISVYSLYTKLAHAAAKLLPQRAMMKVWLWQQKL